MKKLFESFDAVIAPVCSLSAYGAYDIKDAFKKVFEESEFTALADVRPPGAAFFLAATTSSLSVFHSPQFGQRPNHLPYSLPQFVHI